MQLLRVCVVACGFLAVCSCSRSGSDEVARLKAELDAAKADAAVSKAELAKIKGSVTPPVDQPQLSVRLAPRVTAGGAVSMAPAPGELFPHFTLLQWPEGLTVLFVEQAWARASCAGDYYSQSRGVWDAAGDQRYEWRLHTVDGKTATVRVVPGKEYDLSKGALFVIKANGDKLEVHQLSRQLPTTHLDAKAVEEYLNSDGEVRKILGAGKGS